MKRLNKLLSLLLVLCMIMSSVAVVFAEGSTDQDREAPVIHLDTLEIDKTEITRDEKVKIRVMVTDASEIQSISVLYNCNGVINGAGVSFTRGNWGEEELYDEETGYFEAEIGFYNGKAYYGLYEINEIIAYDAYGNEVHVTGYSYGTALDAGTFRVTGGNAEDKAGPVIDYQNIVIDTQVAEGENAKISIPITDASEIYYAQVCYASANAASVEAVTPVDLIYNEETKKFEGEIAFEYFGENNLVYIWAIDANRNQTQFSNTAYTYPRDFVEDALTTVVKGDTSYADVFYGDGSVNDTEKPVVDVSSITLEKHVFERGETVTLTVKITENGELLKTGLSFVHERLSLASHVSLTKVEGDLYSASLPSNLFGQWRLGRIEVVDTFGNTTIFNDSSLIWYMGENLPDTDLSAGDFYVGVIDETTGVSVSDTSMDDTTSLSVTENDLSGEVFSQLLEEDCTAHAFYDVKVEGERGTETSLLIPAPEGLENGDAVRVVHLKSDNTTENLDTTVQNGLVAVTVTEFSPFLLETGFTPAPTPDPNPDPGPNPDGMTPEQIKSVAESMIAELRTTANNMYYSPAQKQVFEAAITKMTEEAEKDNPSMETVQGIYEQCWIDVAATEVREMAQGQISVLRDYVDSPFASAEEKAAFEAAIKAIEDEIAKNEPNRDEVYKIYNACNLHIQIVCFKQDAFSIYTPESQKQIFQQGVLDLEKAKSDDEKQEIMNSCYNKAMLQSTKDDLLEVISCEWAPAEAVRIAQDALTQAENAADEDLHMILFQGRNNAQRILAPAVYEKIQQLLQDSSIHEIAKSFLQQAAADYEQSSANGYPYCALYELNAATNIMALDKYAASAESSATVKKIATETLTKIEGIADFYAIPELVEKAMIDIQFQPSTDINHTVEIAKPESGKVENITAVVEDNAMQAALSGLDDAIPLTTVEKATGVWVWMEVTSKTPETVDTEDAKRIDKALDGAAVGAYLDINLFKQVPGGEKLGVTETDKPVTITIQIPQQLRAANRNYSIIYTHDGSDAKVITPVSCNIKSGELVFRASEFSTYALVYEDADPGESDPPEDTVPETTVPEDTVPETTVPEDTVPETTVPETTVPETTVPETTVPETTVPETTVPETTVPETTVPETTAPEKPATTPQTGDSTNPWLYTALAIMSLLGLGVVLVTSKMSMKGKYTQ